MPFLVCITALAGWNIQSNQKYYIHCNAAEGHLTLGSAQGAGFALLYQTKSATPTAEGYWYLVESGTGFAIQNASTGQYLSWSSDYNTQRNLVLVDAVSGDDQRWNLVSRSGYVSILNVAQPAYCLNMRTTTFRVACYQSGGTDLNEQFRIYSAEGEEIAYSTEESSGLSSAKRYLLHNANGYGYCVYDPSASSAYPSLQGYTNGPNGCQNDLYKATPDLTHANAQWTLVPDGQGNYALYNLGMAQYISNEQTAGRLFYFTDNADPMTFTPLGDGTYAMRLTLMSTKENAYLCAASQNQTAPIANWLITDPGSVWLLEEAATTTFSQGGSGNSDTPSTEGYDTTVQWDGQGDATHRFPDWGSTNQGQNSTTSNYYVQLTEAGQYQISFDWRVSCEAGSTYYGTSYFYDYFYATLQGGASLVDKQGGESSGSYSQVLNLAAGATLQFTYYKDDMVARGEDKAWVQNLVVKRILPVERITLSAGGAQTLNLGETLQLQATVEPVNAANTGLVWSSSDNGVALVSASGLVTAVAAGPVTITATAADGKGATAQLQLEVKDPFVAHDGRYLYLRHSSGKVTLLPLNYIESRQYSGSRFTARLTDGQPLMLTGVIEATEEVPADRPGFTNYKFNNKYNHQLFTDAESTDPGADRLLLEVGCIGKWLTASFQTTSETTKVWVGGVRQRSKQTRLRFAEAVTYRLTDDNWQVLRLRQESDGSLTRVELPYSRTVEVEVTFRSDAPTSQYGVPRIDIFLLDAEGNPGTAWNANNWIGKNGKKVYHAATIAINGGGVYPDMATTPIQIRGRGNSSWSNNYMSKNPYRFKFSNGQKPLGMTKGKHWVLLANKQSGSMTTNAIGQTVAALSGSAGYCHIVPVELYVNGNYRGSYNLTERIGFSNNSINLEDETLAAMVELDTYTEGELYDSNNAYSLPVQVKEPDFEDEGLLISTDNIWSDFAALAQAVQDGDGAYINRVDADYLARYLMVNDLITNCELMHPKSVFAYSENVTDELNAEGKDETPWIFGPVWDCDWAFGYEQSRSYFDVNQESDYFASLLNGGTSNGRAKAFWNGLRYGTEEMNQRYYTLWHEFVNGGALDELIDYCDTYYNFAEKSFTHNRNNQTNEKDYTNYATLTAKSKQWLATRAAYILNSLTPYALPEEPEDDEPVATDKMGDVNDDGLLTAADVVCVLNSLVNLPNETFYASRADLNSDGEVSVADVVLLCNRVMTQPSGVKPLHRLPASRAALRLANVACPTESEVMVPLTLDVREGQYSALQLDVLLPLGVELDGLKLSAPLAGFATRTQLVTDGHYRVLLYADGSLTLPEGETTLHLRVHTGTPQEGLLNVTEASLATAQGEAERLSSQAALLRVTDQTQTSIASTEAAAKATGHTLYDLSGRAVRTTRMQRGVYILNGKKIIQ